MLLRHVQFRLETIKSKLRRRSSLKDTPHCRVSHSTTAWNKGLKMLFDMQSTTGNGGKRQRANERTASIWPMTRSANTSVLLRCSGLFGAATIPSGRTWKQSLAEWPAMCRIYNFASPRRKMQPLRLTGTTRSHEYHGSPWR